MKKIKNFFGCAWAIILLWSVSRIVPSIYRAAQPDKTTMIVIVFLLALPVGWWIACRLTKCRHPWCIRASLGIFALFEAIGILEVITRLIGELSVYTGRYHYDSYGIAYSDYPLVYGAALAFEALYIFLCWYLGIKTKNCAIDEISSEIPILDKRTKDICLLEADIQRMKQTLKEHDAAYVANKKIFDETYTDEELRLMVDRGEITAERAAEYVSQREGLAIFVNTAPQTRQLIVEMIGDLAKQLAELQCE